ncbi:MAG: spore cortex biosynthesis protein YabQ [Clostridia bacterium]|nr:spore cortex biosynthesis protein YabQ [Clostridia bacterium]
MLRAGNTDIATFFISMIVGVGLCLLYDVFRIIRLANKPDTVSGFVQDISFFVMAALVTFFNILVRCSGEIRWFVLLGELLGAICCRLTLSRLIMAISKGIIRFVKAVISLIDKLIFSPVKGALRWIKALFCRVFGFLLKKISNLIKKCLKPLYKVVYNIFIKFFKSNKKLDENS